MNKVDSLLKRLVKTEEKSYKSQCRVCDSPSVASDLCDKCIKRELVELLGESSAEFFFNTMTRIRECHQILDSIDSRIKKQEDKLL